MVMEDLRARESQSSEQQKTKQEGIKVSHLIISSISAMEGKKQFSPSVAIVHSALCYQAQLEGFSGKHTKIWKCFSLFTALSS